MNARRQFQLPEHDTQFLDQYGLDWEAINDGSQWVLLHNFPTGGGYTNNHVIVAIRIEGSYPIAPLDMAYFYPPLARKDGKAIGATEATQQIDGKLFQRWSRHRTADNPWRPGIDCLETHAYLVEDWLQREFEK